PQPRRARCAHRPCSSIAAALNQQPACTGGWLSGRRNPSESRRDENDGTSLADEILLFIFATFLEIADLVRCAATCRRWRRLVSGEAAFICSGLRRPGPGGKFLPPLAVGFFYQLGEAATRFVPMASASRRFPVLREPSLSLSTLAGGGLPDSSRIVASRNGLLVVDLRSGKHTRALKFCVYNPMTGAARVLPPLTGKDGVGHFACTVLTADDYQYQVQDGVAITPPPPRLSSPHYRLLVLYNRRDFTAIRSYSSKDGSWSPERRVTGAQLGKRQMRLTRGGVVAGGGSVSYWFTTGAVFELRLDTLEATTVSLPTRGGGARAFTIRNTALGTTPEGRLCVVQFALPFLLPVQGGEQHDTVGAHVFSYGGGGGGAVAGGSIHWIHCRWTPPANQHRRLSPPKLAHQNRVKLQWFCEKSGVIFFTAGEFTDPRGDLYAVRLDTQMVEKVASDEGDGGRWLWGNLYGYEMDQAAYLASLAEPKKED
ncbi:hypothetical protein PVAP13_6KG075100, partial [Panicum virgatum]